MHPCRDVAALLVSELSGSSVQHGRSCDPGEPVTVPGRAGDGVVRVEVTGRLGPGVPELRVAGGDAEGGCGLQLVAALAARRGWRQRGGRAVTWSGLRHSWLSRAGLSRRAGCRSGLLARTAASGRNPGGSIPGPREVQERIPTGRDQPGAGAIPLHGRLAILTRQAAEHRLAMPAGATLPAFTALVRHARRTAELRSAANILLRGPAEQTGAAARVMSSSQRSATPRVTAKRICEPSARHRSMLLCLSRGSDDISVAAVPGLRGGCSDRVIAGLRTRQGWAAPGGARKLLLGHAQQVR